VGAASSRDYLSQAIKSRLEAALTVNNRPSGVKKLLFFFLKFCYNPASGFS
jgi:hypothetical protein